MHGVLGAEQPEAAQHVRVCVYIMCVCVCYIMCVCVCLCLTVMLFEETFSIVDSDRYCRLG